MDLTTILEIAAIIVGGISFLKAADRAAEACDKAAAARGAGLSAAARRGAYRRLLRLFAWHKLYKLPCRRDTRHSGVIILVLIKNLYVKPIYVNNIM